MKKKNNNSGFSLIELIIAIAVLSFLMLAVSSFMGSSVMHTKKAKIEVRMQAHAQETYSMLSDTIMQASDIIIGGYTASSGAIDFKKVGEDSGATLTKKYYVKDEKVAKAIIANPNAYGIPEAVVESDIVYFKDMDPTQDVYISFMRVESSVPIDISYVPSGNPDTILPQSFPHSVTGETVKVECQEINGKKVYTPNDTLISTFYFEGQNMYFGRQYAFMTDANDKVVMASDDSKKSHLYSKYFSYVLGKEGAVEREISGCVATINAADGTIGIDLYYNLSDMGYTTTGRVNTRNSYVLKPKK
ncbi:MAG: prepilin-type N-terminal cleavage/methylation domain-containing protein [Wujia sp.]